MGPRTLQQLVNHDLRSPIAVVLGQCELMRLRGQLSADDERAVASIERAGQQLLDGLETARLLLSQTAPKGP